MSIEEKLDIMETCEEYTYEELIKMGIKPHWFYAPDAKYDDMGYPVNYDLGYRPFKIEETNEFHLHNCEAKIKCKECGNNKFSVGSGLYNTVIRCNNCEWERTIHEG